ncbi:MAG TPA: alpha/beta hydrolase [Chryseolinea sp.]|nr:alpha/beta hydrolase [Chryseolinea sp.]
MRIVFPMLLCLFIGCRDDEFYKGDFFYLVNKNAQMPVSVRGNTSSGIFVVFLHGGPGGTALQKIGLPAFLDLEKSYATVFWDQRGSGSSQGNTSNDLFTVDQFVEDLDKLIDLLQQKYHHPQIFLLGHSWGGCLGTAYLTDSKRQSKIRGWIELDGAHNNPMGDSLSLNFVSSYATQQIALNDKKDFWEYVLEWYAKNPEFTTDQLEHYSFVEEAHGYIYDESLEGTAVFPNYSFDYLFESPANVTAALTNYDHVIKNFIISDIDLTPKMSNISLPALIIWGIHDGVIPYPMAEQAWSVIGTPPVNKSIVTLTNSAHNGFYEEPEAFATAVRTFIEKYK